jgi:hypothetical protein
VGRKSDKGVNTLFVEEEAVLNGKQLWASASGIVTTRW